MLTGVGSTFTYDESNRLTSAAPVSGGTVYYGYAPDNERTYQCTATGTPESYVYDPRGERIGTFTVGTSGTYPYLTVYLVAAQTNVWFAGKLVNRYNAVTYTQSAVYRDRLGSEHGLSHRYYPYGEEITSTANDTEKFGTYFRDSFTTLDYADQRYYASSYGRFGTPDPYQTGARPKNPGSWNAYACANDDPVNGTDTTGMFTTTSGSDGGNIYAPGFGYGNPACQWYPETCLFFAPPVTLMGDSTLPWEPGCNQNSTGNDGTQYECLHHVGTDWNSFTGVLSSLGNALQSDPECEQFLESGFGAAAATTGAAALSAIFAPGAADVNFQLTDYIIPAPGFAGAIAGAYNQVPGAPIVVNETIFGNTNQYTQYLIILHEIGHLLDPTGYNQADGTVLPDGTSGGAANNQLTKDNCSKTLGD
jgi:RHS repeat-associated protein